MDESLDAVPSISKTAVASEISQLQVPLPDIKPGPLEQSATPSSTEIAAADSDKNHSGIDAMLASLITNGGADGFIIAKRSPGLSAKMQFSPAAQSPTKQLLQSKMQATGETNAILTTQLAGAVLQLAVANVGVETVVYSN